MTDILDPTVPAGILQSRPLGPVEWRSAVVADINRSQRIVEVIAVPYNEETLVEYPLGSGKTIMESVLPGAFKGIDTRSPDQRITVNREHDYGKTIGITRAVFPDREDGLVAELKISSTTDGDNALGLAEDGALGASVGMQVRKSDQRVVGNRRHILRAFLDHISLVAMPAYVGASVLSVREREALPPREPVATPHLDEVQRWLESMQTAG